MKNKGFTLTELLVVMVILGIITAISIPLIRNLRETNEQKEYKNYTESIRYAAKLYVDSYEEDLFGHEESGCVLIPYEELKSKNLVKDIDVNGISCDSEETYVRVVKMRHKYGYAATIGCGKKDSNGNVNVSMKYPKEGIVSSDTCDINAETIMSFKTNITNPTDINYKVRTMKVIISSNTGVNENPIIQYGFSASKTPNVVENWAPLQINPPGKDSQENKIESGEIIEVSSKQIQTPEGLTGNYYLVLRVDRLQDISGKNWQKEGLDSYVYLGPYTVDSTVPEFNESRVISSNASYNALQPKLDLKVTDNMTQENKLKMCISYDTDSCEKTREAFASYEAYNATKILDKIKNALDGTMHKVFVTVVDLATNYTTKEFSYELASIITYQGNGNTGGSTSQTICNNHINCALQANGFTKTGYHFNGWYTAASGGSKYGATTVLTGNITVYAQWIDDIAPTCTTSKVGGVNSEGGITVRVTCSDSGSGCTEATHDYSSQKSNQTYTVRDRAGNTGTCNVSISRYDCHPYDYQCGSYVCGYYACGSYECGGYMDWDEGDGNYGGGGGISGYWYWVPKYCTAYCESYCPSYCTGYKSCYR